MQLEYVEIERSVMCIVNQSEPESVNSLVNSGVRTQESECTLMIGLVIRCDSVVRL